MREESHLDDMRAAIRGDFERLERRLGAQELMHVSEPEKPEDPEEPDGRAAQVDDVEDAEADADEHAEQEGAGETPEPPAEQPSRSWLDRLLGR